MIKKENFQGSFDKNNYFEGWYFKQVTNDYQQTVAFIVGISTDEENKHSFIQVITNHESYYLTFDLEDFSYGEEPFFVKIKDNYFSKEKIILDIQEQGLQLSGTLVFNDLTPLQTTRYRPTIMGPFAYLKHMECNHDILSLGHNVTGTLCLVDHSINFSEGYGYIEKDYGTSFPKYYTWLQSNCPLHHDQASIFCSVAHIPFMKTSFQGLISVLQIEEQQYFFTSYYLSKLKELENKDKQIKILLKNRKYLMEILATYDQDHFLLAPHQGQMKQVMKESVDATIQVKLLTKKKKLLFEDTFVAGGLEHVKRI